MEKRVEPPGVIRGRVAALINSIKRRRPGSNTKPQDVTPLRVAGYSLVLMDPDGQVVWNKQWDAGGAFDFPSHYCLWISCEFTNHFAHEAEIAEYEIELIGEDGSVVERFSSSFGDPVIVVPGQSEVFTGQWQKET